MLMRSSYACFAALIVAISLSIAGCAADSEADQIASAKSSMAKGELNAAAIKLRSTLQTNPNSGEARALLGQTFLAGGDSASALVELEKANQLRWRADQVIPKLAEALVANGQAVLACQRFDAVTLADPAALADLKSALAIGYFVQGKSELGLASIDAALQAQPKHIKARLLKARAIAERGQIDAALTLADAVIVDSPKVPDGMLLKAELLWYAKSDTAAAAKVLHDILRSHPHYLPAHTTLLTLLVTTQDYPAFKTAVAELKLHAPGSPTTLFYDTFALLIEHDLSKARERVQQLLRTVDKSPLVFQMAGSVEYESGMLRAAETHLTQALQLAPNLTKARLLLASLYLRSAQPQKSLAVLQVLLSRTPPDVAALGIAAESYILSGDVSKAEQFYSLAAKATPQDSKAKTALALMQVSQGNADVGFAQLDNIAATYTQSYADLAIIATRLRRNETNEALRAVDRLIAKAADKPLPYLLRGQVLVQREDTNGARASFEKAIAVDPSYFPATSALVSLDIDQNKYEDGRKRLEAQLQRDPQNFLAKIALADVRHRSGAKPDEVIELLTQAVKINIVEPRSRIALVDYLLSRQRAAAALLAAQDAIAALPDVPELLDALGRAQLASGSAQQAIISFSKLVSAKPGVALSHLRLADANVVNNDQASAWINLRKALEIEPALSQAQRNLIRLAVTNSRINDAVVVARTMQKQPASELIGYLFESDIRIETKEWDAAIKLVRQALERGRVTFTAQRLHKVYLQAGRKSDGEGFAASWLKDHPSDTDFLRYVATAAMINNEYTLAESRYRQLLTALPDDGMALNNLAWALMKQSKPGASELAEKAVRLSPADPSYIDTLALTLAAENQFSKALEWQEKAVAKAPEVPLYRLNLAKLLIKSGSRERARTELETLAKLGTRYSGHGEVTALLKTL